MKTGRPGRVPPSVPLSVPPSDASVIGIQGQNGTTGRLRGGESCARARAYSKQAKPRPVVPFFYLSKENQYE